VRNLKIDGFDPLSFLSSLGTGTSTSQYRPGQMVFRQGDAARSLFYVQQGFVQISIISDQGREGVTAIHGPGELFGQESLTHQGIHRTNAVTIGVSTIAKIDNRALIRVLKTDPSTAIMFLSFLLWRNVQIEDDLVDHLFNSSEKRLARHLLKLACLDDVMPAGSKIESVVIPKISQEVLASRIGTTRGRINYFMNKFSRLGHIDYDGLITVRSSLAMVIFDDAIPGSADFDEEPQFTPLRIDAGSRERLPELPPPPHPRAVGGIRP
jgi:CRP-like cAMP-binding protein